MKHKKYWLIPLTLFIISLVTGASFHGFRMHPENTQAYNFGINMGISMAIIAVISFIFFIVMFIKYKKINN